MSGQADPLMRAVDDARALLDTLLSSGWQDIHVASGGTEIFIAREGGRPNPMRQAPVVAPPMMPAATPAPNEVVTAPHVATVVDVLAIGTAVEAGDRVATIRVLEREDVIATPGPGVVTAVHVEAGALVEFKAPIVSLGEIAR